VDGEVLPGNDLRTTLATIHYRGPCVVWSHRYWGYGGRWSLC